MSIHSFLPMPVRLEAFETLKFGMLSPGCSADTRKILSEQSYHEKDQNKDAKEAKKGKNQTSSMIILQLIWKIIKYKYQRMPRNIMLCIHCCIAHDY